MKNKICTGQEKNARRKSGMQRRNEEDMDKEEFTKGVLAAEKSLYYVAKSILRNDEDCADAMQNAILSAYSSLHMLRQEEYFKTWLTRILINECYKLLRDRKSEVSYEEYMEHEEAETSGACTGVFLEVQKLAEQYRVPFVLHYIEGYQVKEIAEMLHTTEGSIKTRLYRSRNLLKEKLKGELGYDAY